MYRASVSRTRLACFNLEEKSTQKTEENEIITQENQVNEEKASKADHALEEEKDVEEVVEEEITHEKDDKDE